MPVPSFTLTCTKNEKIARDVYDFRFAKPTGFSFQAGQFVLFDVALIDNPADVQTRAFSIASADSESELIFVAKLKQGGRASRWVEENLKPGETVRIQGPFGRFVLPKESPLDMLFIATSTGVAPFRAQIIEAAEWKKNNRIDMVFGVRSEEDLFWKDEMELLAQKYENFFLHLALSNPTDEWKGHRGRVQTLVPLIAKDIAKRNVFVCGSPDMTKELKQLCLEQWNVPKEQLHVEGYI
jgi:ferredoxin-NADP reductase